MKTLLSLLLLLSLPMSAREITGTIWKDADQDGLISPADTPLPGILVSDGYRFAETDALGRYRLTPSPKATTLYVHRPAAYQAEAADFWRRLIPQRSQYDFLLKEAPPRPGQAITLVSLGDSETFHMDFAPAVRDFLRATPEAALLVVAGDMGNGNLECLREHRRALTQEHMGVPVAFACGNHDVDFRGKPPLGEACPYQAVFGPWWYSFEAGDYLFACLPIYNSWGAPLLYDMLDCGDWLEALCQRFPRKKKILLCHDLPDLVGKAMKTRTGKVDFDQEDFACLLYGHKHMNIVRNYPSGRKAFCVATPNKGGAGGFAPSFRSVTLHPDTGKIESRLWHPTLINHLHLLALPDGTLCATVNHGGTPIRQVTAFQGDKAIPLHQTGPMTWQGHWEGDTPQGTWRLQAVTALDEALTRDCPDADTPLLWLAKAPGQTAMATMKMVNGLLIAGICDDANAETGGLLALDPATGKTVWHFTTGYGIRNDFATDGQTLFAIDTRANLYAVDAATGALLWKNPSDPDIVSPAASALLYHDGIVAGGYGRHLRGVSAHNGKTLWKNNGWKVEERTPAEDKLALADNDSFLVLSRLNGLYRHDLRTGKVLWLFPRLFLNGTPLLANNGQVLVEGTDILYRLALPDGRLVAEHKGIPCAAATAPMVPLDNGLLLVATHGQGLIAYQADDCTEQWRFLPGPALLPTGDYLTGHPPSVTAPPLPADEGLYVAGNDGAVYLVNQENGDGRRLFQGGAPFLNQPLLQDGILYLADSEGRIMALPAPR